MNEIKEAIESAMVYLEQHPDEVRYTDTAAAAILESGLRVNVTGPGEESVTTDMPSAVGGFGEQPSPSWLSRAGVAACDASLIAMRAAQLGVKLTSLEVVCDSESDDRGILGMDPSVPAGPLSMSVRIRIQAEGVDEATLREIVEWGVDHCPAHDAAKRAIDVAVEVET